MKSEERCAADYTWFSQSWDELRKTKYFVNGFGQTSQTSEKKKTFKFEVRIYQGDLNKSESDQSIRAVTINVKLCWYYIAAAWPHSAQIWSSCDFAADGRVVSFKKGQGRRQNGDDEEVTIGCDDLEFRRCHVTRMVFFSRVRSLWFRQSVYGTVRDIPGDKCADWCIQIRI